MLIQWIEKKKKKRKKLVSENIHSQQVTSYLLFVTLNLHTLSFQYELNRDRSKYNFDQDRGPFLLVQLHHFIFLQQVS